MRRAIVLAMVTSICLTTASRAAVPPKPLKMHISVSGSPTDRAATIPLPDPDVIPPLKQHFEYILPGSCVTAIEKTQNFKCIGPDKEHLKCEGITVTVRGKIDECLQINVVKE